ncbi:MAG: RNA polymerase sigma factor [Pseudomonadota bacterium]
MDLETDEVLMGRIQTEDHQAFTQLVDRHLKTIHGFAWRMLNNVTDAEDIAQETFLRVWRNAQQWQPKNAQVLTWIHRIAHNLCIDLQRRRKRITEDIDDHADTLSADINLTEELVKAQTAQRVSKALQTLPERQRGAIVLCYYQGLSNQEAASVLDISVQALESLMARGRRTLKQLLLEETVNG